MKIIVCKDYDEMSKKGYEVIKGVMQDTNGKAILGLATGSTPIGLYKNMIADFKAGNVSYANTKSVNLDEYVGLPVTHDQSYYYFMHDNLFNHIDIKEENVNLPNGTVEPKAECERYTNLLWKMQQDVQVLGIGSNGHIGFNEPNTPFESTTHIVTLQESTRKDNARFFENDINNVPTHAITMGIKNIMNAKKVLVLASGANKAKAVAAMCQGEVNELCPASVLQNHKDVVVVVDEAAASLLK